MESNISNLLEELIIKYTKELDKVSNRDSRVSLGESFVYKAVIEDLKGLITKERQQAIEAEFQKIEEAKVAEKNKKYFKQEWTKDIEFYTGVWNYKEDDIYRVNKNSDILSIALLMTALKHKSYNQYIGKDPNYISTNVNDFVIYTDSNVYTCFEDNSVGSSIDLLKLYLERKKLNDRISHDQTFYILSKTLGFNCKEIHNYGNEYTMKYDGVIDELVKEITSVKNSDLYLNLQEENNNCEKKASSVRRRVILYPGTDVPF